MIEHPHFLMGKNESYKPRRTLVTTERCIGYLNIYQQQQKKIMS
jgi:hypothetical protein